MARCETEKIKEIIDIVLNKYLMKMWIEISTTEKINNSGKLSFTSFNNAELVLKKILKIKKHLDKRLGKLNNNLLLYKYIKQKILYNLIFIVWFDCMY